MARIICENGINREMTVEEEVQFEADVGNSTPNETSLEKRVENIEDTTETILTTILPSL
jgi:hypothetical protein